MTYRRDLNLRFTTGLDPCAPFRVTPDVTKMDQRIRSERAPCTLQISAYTRGRARARKREGHLFLLWRLYDIAKLRVMITKIITNNSSKLYGITS